MGWTPQLEGQLDDDYKSSLLSYHLAIQCKLQCIVNLQHSLAPSYQPPLEDVICGPDKIEKNHISSLQVPVIKSFVDYEIVRLLALKPV